jgi:hypothetical protein
MPAAREGIPRDARAELIYSLLSLDDGNTDMC